METRFITSKETPSENKVFALVVAKPGRIRSSLQAVLQVMPQLCGADLVSDETSAIEIVTKYRPALVILDVDLPDNQAWILLAQIQHIRPQTRCLFFVNSIEQRRAAKLAGADAALLKGFGTRELFSTVEVLLL